MCLREMNKDGESLLEFYEQNNLVIPSKWFKIWKSHENHQKKEIFRNKFNYALVNKL